jgi:hypothetical protein
MSSLAVMVAGNCSTIRGTMSVSQEGLKMRSNGADGLFLQYAVFRSLAAGRDMAAWLCRRWTGATLAELGPSFGLTGTDRVSNLVRRAEKRRRESANWRETSRHIEASLGLNTEHKA